MQRTRLAIVTAGGICPGLNDVVRALVLKAHDYGVPSCNILGVRYGWRGFRDTRRHKPVQMTREVRGMRELQLL